LNGKDLREHLRAGKRAYGFCVEGFGHPKLPRVLARCGLDFVFMDNEHNPLNRETCAWAAQAYAANNVAPLLRIPEPSAILAAMALDAGAHGVIAPYVETVEQVRALVGATKYRPLKGDALARLLDNPRTFDSDTLAYLERFNTNSVLVVMIESAAGVARLPELLAVPGVDVILVGPHDFSINYAIPEQFDHPVFQAQLRATIRVCSEHQVAVGVHHLAGTDARERRWIAWGCRFIVHKSDTAFIVEAIHDQIGGLRESLGDGARDRDLPFPFNSTASTETFDSL
jgi:4-hydroxy-2-oxoheptanedioate aldolase